MEHEAASSKIVNDAWSTHVPWPDPGLCRDRRESGQVVL